MFVNNYNQHSKAEAFGQFGVELLQNKTWVEYNVRNLTAVCIESTKNVLVYLRNRMATPIYDRNT